MKATKILFTFGFIFLVVTQANAYYTYDANSGNSYNVYQDNNQTQVHGYNYHTGSTWDTTIDRDGNQRGTDSSGNYWNYDSSTGYYSNSNGTTCIGTGYARTCD